MADYEMMRSNMVSNQLLPNKITNPRLLKAFTQVPREFFVAEKDQSLAYSEQTLEAASKRYLLQPLVLAKLLQAAKLEPNYRVLDIGSVTGYGAALLSYLVRHVIALEENEFLYEQIQKNMETVDTYIVAAVHRDLRAGVKEDGPYDVIIIEGIVEEIPPTLFEQLKTKGKLLTLERLEAPGLAQAVLYQKIQADLVRQPLFECNAVLIPSFQKETKEFQF